MFPSEILMIS